MQLKDHYLKEDYETMDKEIKKMQETFLSILNGVETANFTDKQKHMKQIDESLKILMFLNKKKLEHEKEKRHLIPNEQVRRNWF